MKKIALLLFIFTSTTALFAQFTTGNIAVLRVGDSIGTLANTGNPLVIEQYTLAGTFVNMNFLPRTGANAVTLSSTATSEGMLKLSSNSSLLTLFAYRVAPPHTASLAGTTSAAINRAVVAVNAGGNVTIPATTSVFYSANNPRSAVSNGTGFWTVGGNSGVSYGTTTLDSISSNRTNLRVIDIYAGNLFASTAAGGVFGLLRIGTALPTSTHAPSSVYLSTVGSGSGNPSPYDFAFNPDTTICYIADDRSAANGGGIQKWTRTGSTWSLAYTLSTGTVGARGLAVNWNAPQPIVIATTAETSANRVIRIIDSNATAVASTIVTAATNTIYRGVAFTPGTNTLPVTWGNIDASITRNGININWSTSSENNNAKFVIEHSTNGREFTAIGRVAGAGNSSRAIRYNYLHEQANLQITNYYRIKQVDFDGKSEYSRTVTVQPTRTLNQSVETTPNPFNNTIDVLINVEANQAIEVQLMDMIGKVVAKEQISSKGGKEKVSFNTENLNNGVYFIRIQQGTETITRKVIKR